VVVKSLEKNLHKVGGLMGATILGDGRVAPIIDVGALAELNLFSAGRHPSHATRGVPLVIPAQPVLSAVATGVSTHGTA
jgi:hypothetical protein